MYRDSRCRLGALSIGLAILFYTPVAAQQPTTGTITGFVTDRTTHQPVGSVQVHIPGTGIGTLSASNGTFRLNNVRPGNYQLRAQRIGFKNVSAPITVTAGQTTRQNFEIAEEALALDEIVVTGTAGGQQLRAIGNSVAKVDASKVAATTPVRGVEQLLGQRTPGLMVLPAPGAVGAGAAIRIRGNTSMSLTNDPIVFIDGVRMDANSSQGPPGQRGSAGVSRLADINPDDIQSIEIIKGPSAATLYGTEASNGVVQIITKRGATGKTAFDMQMRAGTDWMMNPAGRAGLLYMLDPATNQPVGINLYEYERDNRTGPIFHNGPMRGFAGNLSGGTEAVRYFASASYDNDTGIVDFNWDHRFNSRLNLDLIINPKLSARMNAGYVKRTTSLMQTGFNQDPFSNLVWGNPRTLNLPLKGWFQDPPSEWGKIKALADVDRITTSIELRFNPTTWLTQRLSTGIDVNAAVNSTLFPRQPEGAAHFWGQDGLGRKTVYNTARRNFTLDYQTSAKWNAKPDVLALTTSLGFQYYQRRYTSLMSQGTNFAAEPITTVTGGATRTASEDFEENKTVGAFVQQQFDWRNRVFLTGAVRADNNSAFGSQYNAAIYPKLSGTWVLNEEPFWKAKWVNQLKLRAAWGAAGQQPGYFDASRLYDPEVGYNDQPALIPVAYGNPQLKPERSEELEYGFDAAFLNGRIDVSATKFRRWVKDAIVNRPVPPSSGFGADGAGRPGTQIVNLGKVSGWGQEIGVNGHVLTGRNLGIDLGVQLGTNSNRIEDLGGLSLISVGGRQEHRAGFPIGAIFVKHVVSANIDANGIVLSALCDGGTGKGGVERGGASVACATAPRIYWGQTQPTWQLGVNSAFIIMRNLRLDVRVEGSGGNYNINTEMRASHNLGLTKVIILHNDPLVQATRLYENDVMGLYNASFAKLREVSATYTLPAFLVRQFHAQRGSVTVSGRNLMMLWTGAYGFNTPRDGRVPQVDGLGGNWTWDPEIRNATTSANSIQADFQTILPPTAVVNVVLRFSF